MVVDPRLSGESGGMAIQGVKTSSERSVAAMAVAQRRHLDGKYVQTVVEIGPEGACID